MSNADQLLREVWRQLDLPDDALAHVDLPGDNPCLRSSFAVTTAAQVSIAASALAARQFGQLRGIDAATISIDANEAAAECTGLFAIDGSTPASWAPLSGLYRCSGGWLRIHANFDHHRDRALAALSLPAGDDTTREQLSQQLLQCDAFEAEQAINDAGGAAAAARDSYAWQRHPQARAIAELPLVEIEKIDDAAPRALPSAADAPLHGIRALDLTRILAGPVAGRTLAAYGADVMLVNSPDLPNIEAIADTSRGKLSALLDFNREPDRHTLAELISSAHLFVQGYRPGALDAFGLDAKQLARQSPGIVCVSLSAYGRCGPWANRRGFDSLVQTAAGFNLDEAAAAGSEQPKPMPVQILDYASGFLMAFGASVALARQQREGGSWHVQVSLARTAQWLRSLGRDASGLSCVPIEAADYLVQYDSGYGQLSAIPHAARANQRHYQWHRPSNPPGSHPPGWPVEDQ